MIFTKQVRILFVVPLTICCIAVYVTSYAPWFIEVYNLVEQFETFLTEKTSIDIPNFYSIQCTDNLININQSTIYQNGPTQFYFVYQGLQQCVLNLNQYQTIQDVPEEIRTNVTNNLLFNEMVLINALNGDNSRIIQITFSIAAISIVLIIAVINHYSRRLAYLIADPIDELTMNLRNIDKHNIDLNFSEMLQGAKSKTTPNEMLLLLRSVYDFIGIVKIANEAFIQGNDSQAIIEYAVANQFYLENGNILGAGVIQNNMGVINIRNQRYGEAIKCFRESILCILNEWENYKQKYQIYGINEEELLIDQEYQNLSTIVFNRCFNLCEALSEFLVENPTVSNLIQINDIMYVLRTKLLNTHDYQNNIMANEETITAQQIIYLTQQLWKDANKAYQYCQEIMKYQMLEKSQRELYLTLKLLLSELSMGNTNRSEEYYVEAQAQLKNCCQEDICPLSILEQKLYLYRGMLYLKQGGVKQGAEMLLQSLLVEGKFCAKDRYKTLNILKDILVSQKLVHAIIDSCLLNYEPITRDFIIVLEGSSRMRNQLAMLRGNKLIQQIVDSIQSNSDRISYGILSDSYVEMIPLIEKMNHNAFIDKTIALIPKPNGRVNLNLEEIAKKYPGYRNRKYIEDQLYLVKNGIAICRYVRVMIYVCYDCDVIQMEGINLVIFRLGQEQDLQYCQMMGQFEQLKLESSNYFLEQTI